MKYFRKHPDLLFIANYPSTAKRVRQVRQTTPQELSKILVHTITGTLVKTKKILLLTDTPADKQHAGWITQSVWAVGKPHSLFRLISRLIYNHEARTVCILFHPELFGRFWTDLFTMLLIGSLRLTGKRTMIVFLKTPKLPIQPTIGQTFQYFLRFALTSVMTTLTTIAVVGEKFFAHKLMRLTGKKTILAIPMTFRTLKERRIAGKIFSEELFPSPTHNLGLSYFLKKNSALS